jgi:hypothetical protein
MRIIFSDVLFDENLGDDKQDDDETPENYVETVVMPKSHEGNCGHSREYRCVSTKGNVEIPDEPLIKPSMPHSPKALKAIIVEQASTEIIHYFNSIQLSPQPVKSPNYEKFVPNKHKMKKSY